jgi:hypothetical protein
MDLKSDIVSASTTELIEGVGQQHVDLYGLWQGERLARDCLGDHKGVRYDQSSGELYPANHVPITSSPLLETSSSNYGDYCFSIAKQGGAQLLNYIRELNKEVYTPHSV